MAKTLNGIIKSTDMQNTVIVEVTRRIPHPKYKKLMKRSKKFAVSLNGNTVKVGDSVTITETRPISKRVHFLISKINGKEKVL